MANVFISKLEFRQVPAMTQVRNPRYIPLTVDRSLYHPRGERQSDLVFTTATMTRGNGERKCVRELIEAVAHIHRSRPDLRFVIVGQVDPIYPALAASLGIADCVEFPGEISREQKIEYMQRCTLYLQPSRFEGFGLAIAEALACGAPVVTSAVGAVPEVVGSAARFVDGSSPDQIAEGVLKLLDEPLNRIDLSRLGQERIAQRFGYERHRQEWAAVIAEVL
jgi:glycosyltransferase involved in cell wall biosynthesis